MKRLKHSFLGSALILVALWLTSVPAHAQFSYVPLLYNGSLPLCRLGINGALKNYPIKPLRLSWYLDYSARNRPIGDVSYFPMLRLLQTSTGYNFSLSATRDPFSPATESDLRAAVIAQPGAYWFIGNEPDRVKWQDDLEPHVYAQAYHDLYHIIKDADPTAKIVAGTIVQPTPVRLKYLDLVLESYSQSYGGPMPVDVWAFHNFILNEASCEYYAQFYKDTQQLQQICWGAEIPPGVDAIDGLRVDVQDNDNLDLFKQQVVAFRQWMADRGYRNTPAFLSEFGILMPKGWYSPDFDDARVNNFMNATFDYLLNAADPNIGYPADNNRLVQRFAWYSVYDKDNHNGYLFDYDLPVQSSMTATGANFAQFSTPIPESVDFYPVNLYLVGTPPSGQGAANLTFQAVIANSGNLGSNTGATVHFYNGDPNNGGTLIGSEQVVNLQGCGATQVVQTTWNSVPPGNYDVFVQVRTNHGDIDGTNNLRSIQVSFN